MYSLTLGSADGDKTYTICLSLCTQSAVFALLPDKYDCEDDKGFWKVDWRPDTELATKHQN